MLPENSMKYLFTSSIIKQDFILPSIFYSTLLNLILEFPTAEVTQPNSIFMHSSFILVESLIGHLLSSLQSHNVRTMAGTQCGGNCINLLN